MPVGIVTMMTKPRWEHLEHGADIGVRGYGSNLAEAFIQAALSLSSVVTDLGKRCTEFVGDLGRCLDPGFEKVSVRTGSAGSAGRSSTAWTNADRSY